MRFGRGAVLALWLALLILAGIVVGRARFSTDMSAFLPRAPTAAQQMLVDQLREGVVSRLVLLSIEGAPPQVLIALSRDLAAGLRADARFTGVINGEAVTMSRDREWLWTNRYLLSPGVTAEAFSVPSLHAALEHDVALLGSDLGMMARAIVPADPTGELLRLLDRMGATAGPRMDDGVWVSRDGTRALLMVQSAAPGFDIDAQEAALGAVDAAFATARQAMAGAASARLVRTGPPVFAVMTRAQIKGDAERLSLLATMLVVAVLLIAYRSARVLVLALLPVASGALTGVAAVAAWFGFVHGITLGFGVTLIGEAVDYAIYLFTQTPPGQPARATLPRIWPTLRLGMLTSVCGFSAMLLSDFDGFAQLGLFTIVGLLVALGVTRFVLPALAPTGFAGPTATAFARPLLALIWQGKAASAAVLVLTLFAAGSLAWHTGPVWEDELSSMSPLPKRAVAQDAALRREIGAPDVRYLAVVHAPDRERALQTSEHVASLLEGLVARHAITGFDAPSQWLPSQASQTARQAALPDSATLSARLAEAASGTPFRLAAFAPFLAAVEAARHVAPMQPESLAGTGLALRLDSLLAPGSGGWTAMLPLQGVATPAALADEIAGFGVPGLVFLDLKGESDHLLATYRQEALTLSIAGGLVIVVLLAVSLRRPAQIAAVLLPLAAAVICTTALLLAGGARLSIFNLFGLLLVVAVGSNYCLFFARPPGDPADRQRMIASLVLADLCTVIGFGVLSFSGVPVLHGIGGTVAIGACLSLVFAAVRSRPA